MPMPFKRQKFTRQELIFIFVFLLIVAGFVGVISLLNQSTRDSLADLWGFLYISAGVCVFLFAVAGTSNKKNPLIRFLEPRIDRLWEALFGRKPSQGRTKQCLEIILFILVYALIMAWLLGFLGF